MPSLRELGLKPEETTTTDWGTIPEQRGAAAPLIDPGSYTFQLGSRKQLETAWDKFEATIHEKKVERIAIVFSGDNPLPIVRVATGVSAEWIGFLFHGRISNMERNRARKGQPEALASDMDYLLRDGLDHKVAPKKGAPEAEALMTHAGELFDADVEWRASCSKKNKRWIDTGTGIIEDPEGKFGCGTNVYQSGIPRDAEGRYLERFPCKCGASLRCFADLTRFRKASAAGESAQQA